MATTNESQFDQLAKKNDILEVGMDQVDILSPGQRSAIGTQNLNACICLTIVGKAIILSHIGPLLPHRQGASSARPVGKTEGKDHPRDLVSRMECLCLPRTGPLKDGRSRANQKR